MLQKYIRIAALFALLAVVLGAFGAHGLKSVIAPEQVDVYRVGIRYHFYHSFGIFIIALLYAHHPSPKLKTAALFHCIGIVLFSGSLYLLSCRYWLGIDHWTWLGPITPIGGSFFILGWLFVYLSFWKEIG